MLVLICVRAVVHRRRSILRDVRGAYPKIQMNQGRLKTVQICLYLCGCPLLLVGCISVPAAIGGILTQVANEIQQITTMLQFFIFGTVCLDLSVGILYYIPLYLEGEPGGDEPLETEGAPVISDHRIDLVYPISGTDLVVPIGGLSGNLLTR